ncbi:MAG TPA: proteasome activator [Acidimicrobiia bacterium]|nr:proteasome activator [Acidimicrobiia bacterium]
MTDSPSAPDDLTGPQLVEVLPPPGAPDAAATGTDGDESPEREQVSQPSKLIRIATMVKSMLEEVRQASLDEAGRQRLRQIHERSLAELSEVLSEDLREELGGVMLPFDEGTPSESELRIAQAQLVGWLEGLFHGIQATMMTQQMMAQQQLEQMRRKALPPGQQGPGPGPGPGMGQYL